MKTPLTLVFMVSFPLTQLVGCATAAEVSRPQAESSPVASAEPSVPPLVVPYGETAKTAAPTATGLGATATEPPAGTASAAPTRPTGVDATPTATPDLPIVPDGDSAATGLAAEPGCDTDGRRTARLRWVPAIRVGAQQRIDVAARLDGFELGEFGSSPTLAPEIAELTWNGYLEPGVLHAWRVLTRQADTWASSEVATFAGPLCGRDPVTPTP